MKKAGVLPIIAAHLSFVYLINFFIISPRVPGVNPLFAQFPRLFFMEYPLLRNDGEML